MLVKRRGEVGVALSGTRGTLRFFAEAARVEGERRGATEARRGARPPAGTRVAQRLLTHLKRNRERNGKIQLRGVGLGLEVTLRVRVSV